MPAELASWVPAPPPAHKTAGRRQGPQGGSLVTAAAVHCTPDFCGYYFNLLKSEPTHCGTYPGSYSLQLHPALTDVLNPPGEEEDDSGQNNTSL